ncbi:MAG: hypothetical protein NUV81_03220 [bacterium]|nr:hypothetical protein [bacterium]
MKKAVFYSLVGAGVAIVATPLITFAQNAQNATRPDQTPKTCEERVSLMKDRLQNGPEKFAEMREKMAGNLEERIAKLPAEKQDEARARFVEMQAKQENHFVDMKAKVDEILARLDGICSQGEDAQKAFFQEIRTKHQGQIENIKERRQIQKDRRTEMKPKIKDFRAKRRGFRPMHPVSEESES